MSITVTMCGCCRPSRTVISSSRRNLRHPRRILDVDHLDRDEPVEPVLPRPVDDAFPALGDPRKSLYPGSRITLACSSPAGVAVCSPGFGAHARSSASGSVTRPV